MSAKRSNEVIRMIRCTVGADQYCFEMSQVVAVQRADVVQPATNGPTELFGTLRTSRGNAPVYRLAALLRKESIVADDPKSVLLLETPSGLIGLAVDTVSRATVERADRLFPAPHMVASATRPVVEGVLIVDAQSPSAGPRLDRSGSEESNRVLQRADGRQTELILRLSAKALDPATSELQTDEASSKKGRVRTARKGDAPTRDQGHLVVFSSSGAIDALDEWRYGLSLGQVMEVVSEPTLVSVPLAPRGVRGLMAWRQQPVPVIDLPAYLGLRSQDDNAVQRCLIVQTERRQEAIGIVVDPMIQRLRMPIENGPIPVPDVLDRDIVCGAFRINGKTLVIPDLRRIAATALQTCG